MCLFLSEKHKKQLLYLKKVKKNAFFTEKNLQNHKMVINYTLLLKMIQLTRR